MLGMVQMDFPCTNSFVATVKSFVADKSKNGVLKAYDVSIFLHGMLSEDAHGDGCDSVPVQSIRSRLRTYTNKVNHTIGVEMMGPILQDFCMVTVPHDHMQTIIDIGGKACVPIDSRKVSSSQSSAIVQQFGAQDCQLVAHVPRNPTYEKMDAEELRDELHLRDIVLAHKQDELKSAARKTRYWEEKCAHLAECILERDTKVRKLEERMSYRKGNKNVSLQGAYSIALARNHSHIGAQAIVKTMASDADKGGLKHKDFVIRFEHHACSAQRYCSKDFYKDWNGCVQDWAEEQRDTQSETDEAQRTANPIDGTQFDLIETHVYMGDATNEEAVQNTKVNNGFIWSALCEAQQLRDAALVEIECPRTFCPVDCIPVATSKAAETLGIMRKQFKSVGCPDWTSPLQKSVLRMLVFLLDKGSDNQWSTRIIRESLEGNDMVFFLRQFCLLHQFSLLMMSQYALLETWIWDTLDDNTCFDYKYIATVSAISTV